MNIGCTYTSILFKLQKKDELVENVFYFLSTDKSVAFNNENKKIYPNQ